MKMKNQLLITISGPQGCGKTVAFTRVFRSLVASRKKVFAFDGEGSRMGDLEREKMSKADIVILTKQTYKKRRIKKNK